MGDKIVVFVTAGSREEADLIAGRLVESKLAACVNVVEGMSSLFSWQGKIEKENEVLLIVKTRKGLFAELAETVKKLHKYEVPEIIALPIVDGSGEYLNWIEEVCKE